MSSSPTSRVARPGVNGVLLDRDRGHATSPIERVLDNLDRVQPSGDGWSARCPAHDDTNPSLSVHEGDDGRVLLHCFAGCTYEHILAAIGKHSEELRPQGNGHPPRNGAARKSNTYPTAQAAAAACAGAMNHEVIETWDYHDSMGAHAMSVVRLEPQGGGPKTFRPISRREGGWRVGDPPGKLPLYQLPDLAAAELVFVAEGEKCVDRLRDLGLVATTSAHGAKGARKSDWQPLAGKDVVILPDHDEPGRGFADDVANALLGLETPSHVCVVELPGLAEGEDIFDWIGYRVDQGLSTPEITEDLLRLVEAAEPVTVPARPRTGSGDCGNCGEEGSWPNPIPLDAQIPTLPRLPPNVLGGWFGEMVDAVATATETPPELPAAMGLGVLATAVQGRFRVEVKEGYIEPLPLWPCPAMESGSRKTEVMRQMTQPLNDWERDEAERLRPELEKDRSTRKVEEARIRSLTNQAARAKEPAEFRQLQEEIATLEGELRDVRSLPRLFTSDATPEQLAVLLERNGERMAYISDEGGVVEIMAGRYSAGLANLDVFLQGHSGSPMRVDRGCRDPVLLNAPTLTVVLSPQPDVLRDLFSRRVFRGRGLLARFLFLLPKSLVGYRTGTTPPVPAFVRSSYANGIRTLLDAAPPARLGTCKEPRTLSLADSAQKAWHNFFLKVDRGMRAGERFEHCRDWASKFPGAIARIAALLHLADTVDPVEGTLRSEAQIGAETMDRALRLGRFLAEHTLAVYHFVGADSSQAEALKVLGWLRRKQLERVSVRDVYQGLKGTFRTMEDLRPALKTLIEHYYVAYEDPEEAKKAGRPSSPMLLVNPAVVKEWGA